MKRAFQILIVINFHEMMKIECDIQRPSSSELPLSQFHFEPNTVILFCTFEKITIISTFYLLCSPDISHLITYSTLSGN